MRLCRRLCALLRARTDFVAGGVCRGGVSVFSAIRSAFQHPGAGDKLGFRSLGRDLGPRRRLIAGADRQ